MFENAIIFGSLIGLTYELGQRGYIPNWGAPEIHDKAKLFFGIFLFFLVSAGAETWRGTVLIGLCTVGSFKMTCLIVAGLMPNLQR